jgi:hypothetical protein
MDMTVGLAEGFFRQSGGRDRGEGVKQACRYVRGSNMLCQFYKSVSQATSHLCRHITLHFSTGRSCVCCCSYHVPAHYVPVALCSADTLTCMLHIA